MADDSFADGEHAGPISNFRECPAGWHRTYWFHDNTTAPPVTMCLVCEVQASRERVSDLKFRLESSDDKQPENRIESILLAMRAYNPAASDQMRAHLNGLRASRRRLAARSGQARDALRNGEIEDAFGLLEEGEGIWRDIIAGEDRISSLWLDESDGIEPWQWVAIVGLLVVISYIAMMVLAA